MRRFALFFCALLLLGGCSKKSSPRQWSPDDHDRLDEGQAATQAPSGAAPTTAGAQSVWAGNCAGCHGSDGKGQTALGKRLGVPDLTRAEWQKTTSDQAIRDAVQHGKGAMPAFGSLSVQNVDQLLQQVRAFAPKQP